MDHEQPPWYPATSAARQPHLDYSSDFSARVRETKEGAQRKLEAFGHVSEYDVRKIYGERVEITYNGREEESSPIIKPVSGKVVPHDPSRKESRRNVDRQTSLEFSAGPEQRKKR
jgi:hypothetical protein